MLADPQAVVVDKLHYMPVGIGGTLRQPLAQQQAFSPVDHAGPDIGGVQQAVIRAETGGDRRQSLYPVTGPKALPLQVLTLDNPSPRSAV
jgi:hypothetical protein